MSRGANTRAVLSEHLHDGDMVDDVCGQVVKWVGSAAENFSWTGHALTYPPAPDALHGVGPSQRGVRRAFGLHEVVDGPLVGYGELVDIDKANLTARIVRLIVDPAFRGRGLGSACARLLVAEAFKRGLQRVDLVVPVQESTVIRAVRHAGFKLEGTLEDGWHNNGDFGSLYLFSRTNRV